MNDYSFGTASMSSVHTMSNGPGEFTRIRPRPQDDRDEGSRRNLETTERIVSFVVGAIMVCGFFQQSVTGVLTGVVGLWLVYRGTTGHCPVCSLIATRAVDDDVDALSDESTEETEVEEGYGSRTHTARRHREPGPSLRAGEDWGELEDLPRERKPARASGANPARSRRRRVDEDFQVD